MKKYFLLTLLCSWAMASSVDLPIRGDGGSVSYATENLIRRRGELVPPPSLFDLKELNRVLFNEEAFQVEELKKVKYYLLNGEIRMARAFLSKLTYTPTKLKPVINRYQAILAFIEGDFKASHKYLSQPELQSIPQFGKICTLKVLNEVILNKVTQLESDWSRCQIENVQNFKDRNLIWLEVLVQLKLDPRPGITKVPFKQVKLASLDLDELKLLLKLALYLNQEKLVEPQIAELTLDQVQDLEVRELAGQIYFRNGEFSRSYRFIEDLKSPNAENIKGNFYVLRKKYELAYAQFKLALEQKQNSQNALERLLPLAWLLGDWEGGSKYAEQVIAAPSTQINKLTLIAGFLMQKGDYPKAEKVLRNIAYSSRRGAEIEVTQLASFTALMQNQSDEVKKQALPSCAQYDLMQCWTLFQMTQWDSFPLSIRREEAVVVKNEWEKLTKEDINQPLTETVFVNQLDVEEMDDKLIQLIQTTP